MKSTSECNAYLLYVQLCENLWKETLSNPLIYSYLDNERCSFFNNCKNKFDPEIERLINPSIGKAETLKAYCTMHRAMRGVDFCINPAR